MRPYLAILKDSFREAFASHVLWLTLGLIALFLLAIAPLSLTPGLATELRPDEIRDAHGLLNKMIEDAAASEPSPGKHLWSVIPEASREQLREAAEQGQEFHGHRKHRFRRELNALIARDDFYDAPSWQDVELDDQLTDHVGRVAPGGDELRGRGNNLEGDERTARNRRLLAAAFPDFIRLESDEVMYLNYFTWKLDSPIPVGMDRKAEIVNEVVVATCAVLLGFLGIFISILVTASLVPHTFEAGEISLLLSKPVSRTLLFLTRFLGGCAFTLLNALFLMGGLWLVVGLRFDVWNHRLLLCVPLYLFLFLIYYAVSATVGALWRNSILAICLTLVFWFGLFLINAGRESVEKLVIAPNRITEIVPAGDDLLAVNESREVLQWKASGDSSGGEWSEIFREPGGGPPRIARRFAFAGSRFRPTYDAAGGRILAVEPVVGGFGSVDSSQLLVASRDNDWQRESAGRAPSPIHSLFIDPSGRVILVGLSSISEFTGQSMELNELQQWITDKLSGLLKRGNRDAFHELRPDGLPDWKPPFDVDMDPATGDLAVYSDGNLILLKLNGEGAYEVSVEREAVAADNEPAVVALAGNGVLLAVESGEVTLLDRTTLQDREAHRPFEDNDSPPRKAVASPDGQFVALISQDERVWLYDVAAQRELSDSVPGQGDIHAVAFSNEGQLLIADRTARVRGFAPGDSQPQAVFAPELDIAERAYRYALVPLYTILPKPNELSQLVADLLTNEEAAADEDSAAEDSPKSSERRASRSGPDLWTPLWSNLAFLAVILTFTCWRISHRDF